MTVKNDEVIEEKIDEIEETDKTEVVTENKTDTEKKTTQKPKPKAKAKAKPKAAPKPRKRETVKFEQHEEVVVTSLVKRGTLVFEDHENVLYEWLNYGEEQWMSIKALYHMRNRHRGFFTEPLVMVDEDVATFLKIDVMYKDIIDMDNIESIFNFTNEKFKETLIRCPKGIKNIIVDMAVKMIEDGTLDSMKKVRIIESICKVELNGQSDRTFIINKKKK